MTAGASTDLSALLHQTRYLLLDFDGPICAIFATRPAHEVARELVSALRADGIPVPDRLEASTDPFVVLRFAGALHETAAQRVDARLQVAELEAALTAKPTPHAAETISSWRDAGRLVAAVSNNSQAAVTAYLTKHDLSVDLVVGRTSPDPGRLKPNPHLVSRAIDMLGAAAEESIFVGDSVSDIAAGRDAGIATIGYANKPGKYSSLTEAGADVVIDSMRVMRLDQERSP